MRRRMTAARSGAGRSAALASIGGESGAKLLTTRPRSNMIAAAPLGVSTVRYPVFWL